MIRLRHGYRPWTFPAEHERSALPDPVSLQELLLEVVFVVALFVALCVTVALLATGLPEADVLLPVRRLLSSA